MKTARLALAALFLGALCTLGSSSQERDVEPADVPPAVEEFALRDLVERRREAGGPYLAFLERDSLSCGIYHLAKGTPDGQSPHALDEVYYVLEGRAKLEAGGAARTAEPGDVLFVGARVEHRFIEVEEDLTLLVFFSKRPVANEKGG